MPVVFSFQEVCEKELMDSVFLCSCTNDEREMHVSVKNGVF